MEVSDMYYVVCWYENGDNRESSRIDSPDLAWAEMRKHDVTMVPEMYLVINESYILVASLYTVNWLYLADHPQYRSISEVVKKVQDVYFANSDANVIGSPLSYGCRDCLDEEPAMTVPSLEDVQKLYGGSI